MSRDNEKPAAPSADPTAAEETVESLWRRLGQMIFRRPPDDDKSDDDEKPVTDTVAALALERSALRADRARLHLDRDLGPYLDRIEPGQLEKIEPLLLQLKTAELDGDSAAAKRYVDLKALLPALASSKTGE